jgi:hypothetical protein
MKGESPMIAPVCGLRSGAPVGDRQERDNRRRSPPAHGARASAPSPPTTPVRHRRPAGPAWRVNLTMPLQAQHIAAALGFKLQEPSRNQ